MSKKYDVSHYAALTHLTLTEAAQKLGVSKSAVSRMARNYGLCFRSRRNDRIQEYRALQHLTRKDVAAKLDVTLETVIRVGRDHGMSFADQRRVQPAQPVAPPATVGFVPAMAHAPPGPAPVRAAPAAPAETAGLAPAMCHAPAWSIGRDWAIAETEGRYAELRKLSDAWALPIKRIESRWHVLRAKGGPKDRPSPGSVTRSGAREGAR